MEHNRLVRCGSEEGRNGYRGHVDTYREGHSRVLARSSEREEGRQLHGGTEVAHLKMCYNKFSLTLYSAVTK